METVSCLHWSRRGYGYRKGGMEVLAVISPPIELHVGVCFKMRDSLQPGMPKKGNMLALAGW